MLSVVIDEDMPRSLGPELSKQGYEVKDIRDYGLRGATDGEVFHFAQQERAVLMTGDLGFGNILRFPLGEHFGVVVARFPNEMSSQDVNRKIVGYLTALTEDDLRGNLVVVEPAKIRIRRKR
jgi:predicted nuclease of predicted toxin-antitoxin system